MTRSPSACCIGAGAVYREPGSVSASETEPGSFLSVMLPAVDRDLGGFLRRLEAAGEVLRVREGVSANLEIAEIADRQSKSPCPAVSAHARAFDPDHCGSG